MTTYADVIAKLLADERIEYIFGMPGSRASVELIQASEKQGIHYVLSNNESAAAVMAATYGLLRQRPGICSTGLGPGAANAVNGVAHAYLERAPMLLFTDRYPEEIYRHLARQRIDQEMLFRPVTKGNFPIATDTAEKSTRRALQLAIEGRPGPVHLDLPDDVMLHESKGLPKTVFYKRWNGAMAPSSRAIQQVADSISQAERPVVVAGLGVNREGCEAQLKLFMEALRAPALLQELPELSRAGNDAHGQVPEDDPRSLQDLGPLRAPHVLPQIRGQRLSGSQGQAPQEGHDRHARRREGPGPVPGHFAPEAARRNGKGRPAARAYQ